MADTFLITGASRGIGLSLTKHILSRGNHVVALVRKRLGTDLDGFSHSGLRVIEADVNNRASLEKAAKMLDVHIDVIINNAGILLDHTDGILDCSEGNFIKMVDTNLIGPFRVLQVFLPFLSESSRPRIVNISSQMGSFDSRGGGFYGYKITKAALNRFTTCLADELGSKNMTVISMCPGWVKTDMGGPGAPLDLEESIPGIVNVIEKLNKRDNGMFINHQGKRCSW